MQTKMEKNLEPYGTNVVIQRDGLILAVARRDDPNDFSLPGGKIDKTDASIEAACQREIKEETGLEITSLQEVHRGICQKHLAISFLCDYTGEPRSQAGEPECRWVEPKVLAYGCFGNYNRSLFDKLKINY